jgi:hypothetical protein
MCRVSAMYVAYMLIFEEKIFSDFLKWPYTSFAVALHCVHIADPQAWWRRGTAAIILIFDVALGDGLTPICAVLPTVAFRRLMRYSDVTDAELYVMQMLKSGPTKVRVSVRVVLRVMATTLRVSVLW